MRIKLTLYFYLFLFLLAKSALAEYPFHVDLKAPVKISNDIVFSWPAVTSNIYSGSVAIDHYNIYRSTSPDFAPDLSGHSNRLSQTSNTSYTDTEALLSDQSYFYYVTAVETNGFESLIPSSLGCKLHLDLSYNSNGSNTYWLALPQNINYQNASDLVAELPAVSSVIGWNATSQSEIIWNADGTGTDFPIESGKAYAIVITEDTVLNIVGSYQAVPVTMTYNPGDFNLNWLSLPYPNAYGSASNLATDIGNTTKVGRFDAVNDEYLSWFFLDGAWMGEDFALVPGKGILTVINDDVNWTPSLGYPSVTATIDVTNGLNTVNVNLSGSAMDINGSIVDYQWDYEGDGLIDYADSTSPDTSFTYPAPGTYHPTLLVTDGQGFKQYDYRTVEVFSLDNQISVEDFNPSASETAQFAFTVSNDGLMTIEIYDQDNNLVCTLVSEKPVNAGEDVETWDGKNDSGEVVCDGAYYAVFEYKISGKLYTYNYDSRTSSGGNDVTGEISDMVVSENFSPLEGEYVDIAYTLPEKSLVTIEIKDQTGSVIRHLLTERPQPAGSHIQVWDGANDSGQFVEPGTSFFTSITAVSLADDTIIAKGFAPSLTQVTASPVRFSPAINPYGTGDKGSILVSFNLNKEADLTATVYDIDGTMVRTVNESGLAAGSNQISWNGRNNNGVLLSDGEYTLHLRAQDSNGTFSEVFYVQAEIFY